MKLRFQMSGMPENIAQKNVDVDLDENVGNISSYLHRVYRCKPQISLVLIFQGKVLSSAKKLSDCITNPVNNLITLMVTSSGG
jgi:hypothetical protein